MRSKFETEIQKVALLKEAQRAVTKAIEFREQNEIRIIHLSSLKGCRSTLRFAEMDLQEMIDSLQQDLELLNQRKKEDNKE